MKIDTRLANTARDKGFMDVVLSSLLKLKVGCCRLLRNLQYSYSSLGSVDVVVWTSSSQ